MRLRSLFLTVSLLQFIPGCGGTPTSDDTPGPAAADSQDTEGPSDTATPVAPAPAELERMREFVSKRVAAADISSSYTEEDGTLVDCVKIEAQPAFRDPRLRGHKVQAPPRPNAPTAGQRSILDVGPGCQTGSVPIERIQLDDVARFPSLDAFLHQATDRRGGDRGPQTGGERRSSGAYLAEVHEYAYGGRDGKYTGMMGNFQIFKPFVGQFADSTISQVWATNVQSGVLESAEVGINANPTIYQDYNLHWFIFDFNYGGAGCYNNRCGDFVQTSSTKRPGAEFSNVSKDGGAQYTMAFGVEKDSIGNWWIHANGEWIGYYIASFYSSPGLRDYADRADFGGEIATIDNSPHTSTDMGTGKWPSTGWTHASFVANILTRDLGATAYASPILKPKITRRECYDLIMGPPGTSWGTYFYFGGSGYNSGCH